MLAEIDRQSVLQALAEFDESPRGEVLARYGFRPAVKYLLVHEGRVYDPKAVMGVAHRFVGAGYQALRPNEFDATVAVERARRLGFELAEFQRLWWVFQGSSYERAVSNGYLWAPMATEGGRTFSHWDAMKELRPGDMVINYARGAIRAVSIVRSEAFDAPRPSAREDQQWASMGWRTQVAVRELAKPIAMQDLPDRSPLAGPFDRNGQGKQGYLYAVSPDYTFPLLEAVLQVDPTIFDPAGYVEPGPVEEVPPPVPGEWDPVMDALVTYQNVVLEGVPGTGKSYRVHSISEQWHRLMGRELLKFGDESFAAVVMHPSTSYEDFVEGLRPAVTAAESAAWFDAAPAPAQAGGFQVQNGFFVDVCVQAAANPDKDVLVLLDEINRCNVPSVLGDLLLVLEASKRGEHRGSGVGAGSWEAPVSVVLPYSRRRFFVPSNVYVLATANSADRSVAPIDAALRRRFAFVRLDPEPAAVGQEGMSQLQRRWLEDTDRVIDTVNRHVLLPLLGPDACLGQSYVYQLAEIFVGVEDDADVVEVVRTHWQYVVGPQLVDSVRTHGAEDLLSPQTRQAWFDANAVASDTAVAALSGLDALLAGLGMAIVVAGRGLSRGAQLVAASAADPADQPVVVDEEAAVAAGGLVEEAADDDDLPAS